MRGAPCSRSGSCGRGNNANKRDRGCPVRHEVRPTGKFHLGVEKPCKQGPSLELRQFRPPVRQRCAPNFVLLPTLPKPSRRVLTASIWFEVLLSTMRCGEMGGRFNLMGNLRRARGILCHS